MTVKKKKQKVSVQKNNHIYFGLGSFLLVLSASILFYSFFRAPKIEQNAYAGKLNAEVLFGNCTPDPNSSDRTPPTIEAVDPVHGGTIPAQGLIDNGTAGWVNLKIIVRDNEPPYGGQASAWYLKNGRGGSYLVPADPYPYYTSDLTGYKMNYYNVDGVTNPKAAGQTVTYRFGACDAAGNKGYKDITVTTYK